MLQKNLSEHFGQPKSLMRSCLFLLSLFVLLMSCVRNHYLIEGHKGLTPVFFCKSFLVLALRFRPIFHFALIFVCGVRQGSNFILLHVGIQFSQLSFLKRVFISLLHCPGTLVRNQLTENLRVYFWILNSVSLVCMSIFVPVPHCLDYHAFIIALKSGSLSSPALFIFKSAWLFCINFRINLSISAKKDSRTLIGIGLNLDQFREYCHFNNIVF